MTLSLLILFLILLHSTSAFVFIGSIICTTSSICYRTSPFSNAVTYSFINLFCYSCYCCWASQRPPVCWQHHFLSISSLLSSLLVQLRFHGPSECLPWKYPHLPCTSLILFAWKTPLYFNPTLCHLCICTWIDEDARRKAIQLDKLASL